MSNNKRKCRQCGNDFVYKREDHWFCSGRCVAAYYRAHPNPEDIHEDLPRHFTHACETCGAPFDTNAYAERTGQRKPKYCSSKCRQKAYRDRNGVSENRDYHQSANTRQSTANQQSRTRRNQRQSPPPPPPPPPPRGNRAPPPPPPRRARTWSDALRILGLDQDFSASELKRAYRDLMKQFHPDVNQAPDATARAQEINWAFNYLRQTQSAR